MPKVEITTLVALASGAGGREFLMIPSACDSREAMIRIGWTSRPERSAGPGPLDHGPR